MPFSSSSRQTMGKLIRKASLTRGLARKSFKVSSTSSSNISPQQAVECYHSLPDDGSCCDVTEHSATPSVPAALKLKKPEKLKKRREKLIFKLDSVARNLREAKQRKIREKAPVVGDLHPMAEALPSLSPVSAASSPQCCGANGIECTRHAHNAAGKRKGTPKRRVRQQQFLQDIEQFRRVVHHPVFRSDPASVTSQHVQQWVLHDLGLATQ